MTPPRPSGPSPSGPGLAHLVGGTIPRLGLLFTLFIVAWNYVIFGGSDPYNCRSLVGEGHWPSPDFMDHKWRRWEPTGCRMHSYSRDDFSDCLKSRRVVFVGDSSTRQLYWAAGRRLDHIKTEIALLEEYNDEGGNKQKNIAMDLEGVQLEFVWDPWLNSSDYHTLLAEFREWPTLTDVNSRKEADDSAALLVLGAPGHWAARHGGKEYMDIFTDAIDTAKPHLKEKVTLPSVSYQGIGFGDLPNRLMLVPIQTPRYDQLVSGRIETITPEKIDRMNDHLRRGLSAAAQTHILWAYEEMTTNTWDAYEETGLHVVDGVVDRRLDVLLSARCTAALAVRNREYKYTCCMAYPSLAWGQLFFLLVASGFVVSVLLKNRKDHTSFLAGRGSATAIATLALVSMYCYMTDRTHLFPKTSVDLTLTPFFVKVVGFLVVSLVSFRMLPDLEIAVPTSVKLQNPYKQHASQKRDPGFLSRSITEETKGLLQGVLLIGHFHGVAQEDWAYKIMRFLVAGYIFLSAYGHASYLLSTDDFSFRRVAKVLLRLNLLACISSFALYGDWAGQYDFLPTISFWFLVTYTTLAIGNRWNGSAAALIVKVLLSAVVFTVVIKVDMFLDFATAALRFVLRTGWDARALRDKLADDRFVAYFGMVTAILVQRGPDLTATFHPESLTGHHGRFRGASGPSRLLPAPVARAIDDVAAAIGANPQTSYFAIKFVVLVLSMTCLIVFLILQHTLFHERRQYEEWHPLISPFPLVSYFLLRNFLGPLRRAYLALPGKLGAVCLATYVLHHHAWMAGNGSTILRIGLLEGGVLGGMARKVEEGVLSFVFVWIAVRAWGATEAFVGWLVGEEDVVKGAGEDVTGAVAAVGAVGAGPGTGTFPMVERGAGAGGVFTGEDGMEGGGSVMKKLVLTDAEVKIRVLALGVLVWLGNLVY